MHRIKNVAVYAIIVLMIGWSAYVFRSDLAQLSFAPVLANKMAVLIATALSLLNYLLRIWRWRLFLSRLGHNLPFTYTALTYLAGFAFTLSPAKAGEMARATYYYRIGIPVSTTGAAFVTERALDLLAMVTLAALALAVSSTYTSLVIQALVIIMIALITLALAPWNRWQASLQAAGQPSSLFSRARAGVLRVASSAQQLLTPSSLAIGFSLGLVAWLAEGAGLLVIAAMTPSVSLTLASSVGIYSVSIVIGAISFLPGGLGSSEAVMISMLVGIGASLPDAVLLTFVCRALTLWLAVVIGWIAVLILRRYSPPVGVSQ